MFNLRQSDTESEKFSEEGSDISHLSSETRISMNVQQVTSRYHAIQNTVKVSANCNSEFVFYNRSCRYCSLTVFSKECSS